MHMDSGQGINSIVARREDSCSADDARPFQGPRDKTPGMMRINLD